MSKKHTTPEGLSDLGGGRKSIIVDDEIAYPIIANEYLIIKEQIQDKKLDNWQTLLISIGITFLVSAIISILSYDFMETKKNVEEITEIPKLWSFLIVGIYFLFSLAAFIAFGLSFKYKKLINKSFDRIDKKITEKLNIE
jgi:uncharacterized membrane protein